MSAPSPSPRTSDVAPSRRGRTVLRIVVRSVLGIVVLAVGAIGTVFALSEKHARAHYDVPVHAFSATADSASITRGARLANARFCADCHGEGLKGRIMVESPALGRLAPPNLTNGRTPRALTDEEWERAVRHGVRADNSALSFMPSHEFADLTDADLAAIVAYARSLPANPQNLAATQAGPLMKTLDVFGQMELYPASLIDHRKPHRAQRVAEVSVDYGRYMASTCTGCHGPGLSGGKIPGGPPEWPAASNITPTGIGHYSLEDLTRLLRTGTRPDGSQVNGVMPWRYTQALDDTEIAALYAYLKSVPAREFGQR